MESEENIEPFPSLPTVLGNPAKNAGLPHSHRTATTIEFGQFYFAEIRTFELCSNTILWKPFDSLYGRWTTQFRHETAPAQMANRAYG